MAQIPTNFRAVFQFLCGQTNRHTSWLTDTRAHAARIITASHSRDGAQVTSGRFLCHRLLSHVTYCVTLEREAARESFYAMDPNCTSRRRHPGGSASRMTNITGDLKSLVRVHWLGVVDISVAADASAVEETSTLRCECALSRPWMTDSISFVRTWQPLSFA